MEGDFTDNTWDFSWWAGALQAKIERYGLDPLIDVSVQHSINGPMLPEAMP
jgi:hypothetical protein